MPNRQCYLAGSSKTAPRLLIFSIAMGSDYSFYVKTIEAHAHAFLTINILAIGCWPVIYLVIILKTLIQTISGTISNQSKLQRAPPRFLSERTLMSHPSFEDSPPYSLLSDAGSGMGPSIYYVSMILDFF